MLVLKEFRVDEKADAYLVIKGRQEGIVSWVLAKIGLDPTVELICNRREILYKSSSARKGQLNISIPNSAVTAVVTGYHKPFSLLVTAAACAFLGLFYAASLSWITIPIGFIVAIICLVFYVLNKNMVFGVYNGGDLIRAPLEVKRSVIEGVSIEFSQFERAAALLNRAVLASTARGGGVSRPAP